MNNSNVRKLSQQYIFRHPIDRVWSVINDADLLHKVQPEIDLQIQKGKSSFEEGANFNLKWLDIFEYDYVVGPSRQEENYKTVTYYTIQLRPYKHKFTNVYECHYDTINNQTLLFYTSYFEDEDSVTFEAIEMLKSAALKLFEVWKSMMDNTLAEDLHQTESIILDTNRHCLWAILSDWNNFRKVVPFIADEVIYEGNPCNVGTKFTVKWLKKKVECYMKVKSLVHGNCNKEWKMVIECFGGCPKVPEQEIQFKIIRINSNTCFFEFRHQFKQKLSDEILEKIGKDKKKIMQTLKEKLGRLSQLYRKK